MANLLLERAAHQRPLGTRRGAMERLFTLMFQGFVYNQIWEDPSVDLEALELAPHHRLLTIASGGTIQAPSVVLAGNNGIAQQGAAVVGKTGATVDLSVANSGGVTQSAGSAIVGATLQSSGGIAGGAT